MSKHVMLSYQWDIQELVSQIYEDLQKSGIKCWMDIKSDSSVSNKSLTVGIEKSACVIPFCTKLYQESNSFRREMSYAETKELKLIPILADTDKKFRPSGWLGIQVAGLVYFCFRRPEKYNENIKKLIGEIKKSCPEVVKPGFEEDEQISEINPPSYNSSFTNKNRNNVQFCYGNTYYRIPDSEAKLDSSGKNKINNRWKIFVKVISGNPKLIKKVTFDLGKYLGKFEKHTPNQNNEYVVKMDSWGNIRQRPRVIIVDFTNGQSKTYEHTLHLDDGFMSCPLSLKHSLEPLEYVFGNTYEHIDKPEYTAEGKALEHKWKLFVRILKGDPTEKVKIKNFKSIVSDF